VADRRIVILGAGGHAKVIIEIIRAAGTGTIVGLADADPTPREVLGARVLGDDTVLRRLHAEGVGHAFIAIGDNRIRARAADAVRAIGFELVNAISPAATLSPSARIGRGVAVMAGAVVNADAVLEDLVIVNTRASIDHDVRLGRACHIGPGAALAGGVSVGAEAFIGVGASVIPQRVIGAGSIVGAGASVIDDVAPGVTVVGVPARPLPARKRLKP
jgi:UDP-perosamine 4-acetyltransferase